MRAVLFHAQSTGRQRAWDEFVQRRLPALEPPPQAEALAEGVWFLPLPDCQQFLDALTALMRRPMPLATARTLEFDYAGAWQPVS